MLKENIKNRMDKRLNDTNINVDVSELSPSYLMRPINEYID